MDYPVLLHATSDVNDKRTTLTLAEVQVFAGSTLNVAEGKTATQSSDYGNGTTSILGTTVSFGPASFAVDGDANTFNHVGITTNQVGTEEDTT